MKKLAYGKINLGLQILNKRSDNFHNINTVFTTINIYDILEFKTTEKSISIYSNFDIPTEQNIIYKAAQLLKNYTNANIGIEITLTKNIPSGAGLGGGSSDAATTLLALNELWNLNLNFDQLLKIAIELGSDVPFFLKNGTAVGTGKGEILQYFNYELQYYVLIIQPYFAISTAWAYQNLKLSDNISPKNFKDIIIKAQEQPNLLKDELFNDFETSVFSKYPELENIKKKLYEHGAILSMLSGSGSCMFGLFEQKEQIENAAQKFSMYNTYIATKNLK